MIGVKVDICSGAAVTLRTVLCLTLYSSHSGTSISCCKPLLPLMDTSKVSILHYASKT